MKRTPEDSWKEVLERHIASNDETQPLGQTEGRPAAKSIKVDKARIAAVAGTLAVLLGGAGFLGYLAWANHDRANRWRDRSVLVQDLVADRTRALNRQTARLNVASTTLRKARTAIVQSERDVVQLERRQRELANEKARVEDERAALLSVAGQLGSCNTGLGSLIEIVNSGFQADPADVSNLAAVCVAADDAVTRYLQAFGSR